MFQKRMNKKGQFFIISAMIIIMALFTIIAQYNTIRVQIALEDFKELSEGYATEKPKVINAALFEGNNPTTEVQRFSNQYVSYSQQREPTFGVLSVYRDASGNVHIVNLLNNKVVNINFNQPGSNIPTRLTLFCSNGPACGTSGNVCNVFPGGLNSCTTVVTNIGTYGGQFSNVQTLNGIETLFIDIPDLGITQVPIDIRNFVSGEFVVAETPLQIQDLNGRQGQTVKISCTGCRT